jgi:5-methylcytosine-specific restriction endonuclease McrA
MSRQRIEVNYKDVIDAIQTSEYAYEASEKLGLKYSTFVRRCRELKISFKKNQGGKNSFTGRTKEYSELSNKKSIKRWMILEGTPNKCELCGIPPVWNNIPLSFHLDHIDGNRKNNDRTNLRLLCPNCHSQTPTWGAKNTGRYNKT